MVHMNPNPLQVPIRPRILPNNNPTNSMGMPIQPKAPMQNSAASLVRSLEQQIHMPMQQNNIGLNFQSHILSVMRSIDKKLDRVLDIERKVDLIINELRIPTSSIMTETVSEAATPSHQVTSPLDSDNCSEVSPRRLSHRAIPMDQQENGEPPISEADVIPSAPEYEITLAATTKTEYGEGLVISDETLDEIERCSISRRNFAKNLTFLLFSEQELIGKNCTGRVFGRCAPKGKLDEAKLNAVKMATFKKYPCRPGELDFIWQRECIKAIDKAIRSKTALNPNKRGSKQDDDIELGMSMVRGAVDGIPQDEHHRLCTPHDSHEMSCGDSDVGQGRHMIYTGHEVVHGHEVVQPGHDVGQSSGHEVVHSAHEMVHCGHEVTLQEGNNHQNREDGVDPIGMIIQTANQKIML